MAIELDKLYQYLIDLKGKYIESAYNDKPPHELNEILEQIKRIEKLIQEYKDGIQDSDVN